MECVWIATDADHDRRAARYWFDVVGQRGRRAAPPGAYKDTTDAWRAGEDIKTWVADWLGGDEAEQTEQHDVDDDDMEALFLATCAMLDRMEASSQRLTLYDQAETAYCEGDYDAMVTAHIAALAALYMEDNGPSRGTDDDIVETREQKSLFGSEPKMRHAYE